MGCQIARVAARDQRPSRSSCRICLARTRASARAVSVFASTVGSGRCRVGAAAAGGCWPREGGDEGCPAARGRFAAAAELTPGEDEARAIFIPPRARARVPTRRLCPRPHDAVPGVPGKRRMGQPRHLCDRGDRGKSFRVDGCRRASSCRTAGLASHPTTRRRVQNAVSQAAARGAVGVLRRGETEPIKPCGSAWRP